MNTSIKTLLKDNVLAISFWGSIALFLLTILVVAFSYHNLPPYLPLYNKLAWGYARLGQTYQIFIPIAIPLVFCIINFFLAKKIYPTAPLLARFLGLVSLLVALFTCIFIVKLTLIIL